MTLGERLLEILDEPACGLGGRDSRRRRRERGRGPGGPHARPAVPGPPGPHVPDHRLVGRLDGASVDAARRALDRLESEGIDARLTLPRTAAFRVQPAAAVLAPAGLAAAWDEVARALPEDWSDLYLEVELGSSDEIERAALLLQPGESLPGRELRASRAQFRAARRSGYGAAPMMVRRCLARLDDEQIAGELRVLRVHSETRHVLTQGPVWRDDGRAV